MKYFLFSLLLLTTSLQAQELTSAETSDLINRIAAAREGNSFQTDFREEKRLAAMDKTIIENGTLSFAPPDKFRREVPGKSITVCDGKTLWLYYPEFNEVEKYSLDSSRALRESLSAMTAGLGLQDIAKNYAIQAWKEGGGYKLQLVPKNSALRKNVGKITILLGENLSAKQLEIEGAKGEGSTITFSKERKSALSAKDFTFQPPQGASVSEPLRK
jgi:outer membrane lipoprotein-sorting protein